MNLRELQALAYQDSVEHGWFQPDEKLNVGERLMRIVMEVSEAGEISRKGLDLTKNLTPFPSIGKPEGFPAELADVILSTLELAAACGVDLQTAVEEKMAYNRLRPKRSGGKLW